MKLKDNIDFVGHFGIKAYKADGTIEEYEDKNLIMDDARENMAQLVGGITKGEPINKFVIGTEGHVGDNILNYRKVGSGSGVEAFNSARGNLFSEAAGVERFAISFNPLVGGNGGAATVTTAISSADTGNNQKDYTHVSATVSSRTVTYVITIDDAAGNNKADTATSVIAYTEAALYAGADIFSMKTFPARVKEDTVKFEITWSIIF